MNTLLQFTGGFTADKRRAPGAVQFYKNELTFTATEMPEGIKDITSMAKAGVNRMKKSGYSFVMVSNRGNYGLVEMHGNQVLVDLSGDNFVAKYTFEII